MAITAPYDSRMGNRIRESIKHVCKVYTRNRDQVVRELEVIDVSVTFDEMNVPFITASVTAVAPRTQALLDELDPRNHNARVIISAGYAFPGEPDNIFPLADLVIRSRTINRPENTITLTLQSEECIILDGAAGQVGIFASSDGVVAVIKDMINEVIPNPSFVLLPGVDEYGPGYGIQGSDLWDMIKQAQDSVGFQVFNDGRLGNFTFAPQAALAETPHHDLRTGPAGTVIASSTDLSRDDDWANRVILYFGDSESDDNYLAGTASITSGPMAVAPGNLKVYSEDREPGTSQAEANAAAASVLQRRMTYGRSVTLTAVAAYWLRPRMTTTVQLPKGDTEYHLVSAVVFEPISGTMIVKTRRPEGSPTISLGA